MGSHLLKVQGINPLETIGFASCTVANPEMFGVGGYLHSWGSGDVSFPVGSRSEAP